MNSLNLMAEYVYDKTLLSGGMAVILGSGLGDFADTLENSTTITYDKIPGYPKSTVKGHAGEFVYGYNSGIPVLAAKGRFHYYEGYDFHTVTLPIRLMKKLGMDHVIITNAAGSTRKENAPGDLMLVTGIMDCTFRHSANKPVLYMNNPYFDQEILTKVRHCADKNGIGLKEGTYCWTQGPAYETPAEVALFTSWGADALGMSTFPEIVTAGEMGLPATTLSALTNFAAGITSKSLTHAEVIETADRIKPVFIHLLSELVAELYTSSGNTHD